MPRLEIPQGSASLETKEMEPKDPICLIYGSNPEKYAYLVKDNTLPEERAELCREDYPKISTSWHQLLSSYIKH